MGLSFFKNLLGVKADQAVQSGIELYVKWDPTGASEAELKTMEGKLDELGLNVAKARARFTETQKSLDTANTLLHQRMTAADSLQAQIEATTDPARKASLEKSLGTLIALLEQMTPEVEQGKKDAADAHDFVAQLEDAYSTLGEKLKGARGDLERAQREMERARMAKEAAAERAGMARNAAGLGSSGSSVNIALKAMHDAAEKDRQAAEAQNAKAALLKPTSPETDDPNIAAALAGAQGKPTQPQSLSERLAALKNSAA
jgi:chromosome segregation ATPase